MMKKFVTFLKRHKICLGVIAFFIFLCKGFLLFWVEYAFANIVTPIRCQQWAGKELEVFLTPEEWRKETGVQESLKDTKWIPYILDSDNEFFFIKNKDYYKSDIFFDGEEYRLSSINEKYPNLNIYLHINNNAYFGNDRVVLYDQNLNKILVKYNEIVGYVQENILVGIPVRIACDKNIYVVNFIENLKTYLN